MMTRIAISKRRAIARILWPSALVAVLAAIWALTVQTPAETSSLSGVFSRALVRISHMDPTRASWTVRKVAHTFEFFPVGLFLSLSAFAWETPLGRIRRRHLVWLVITLCLAFSLGDQVHKTFVPGREFDALDMVFDAAGYALGILVASRLHGSPAAPQHLKG